MDKKYFSRAGDIENDFFKKAGDLSSIPKESSSFFQRPGDIPETPKKESTPITNIEDYLLKIVSGKKYDTVCELGILVGGGNIIVDLNKLQEMVNSGINIVRAKYINDKIIEIEFQEFRKNDSKGMGR